MQIQSDVFSENTHSSRTIFPQERVADAGTALSGPKHLLPECRHLCKIGVFKHGNSLLFTSWYDPSLKMAILEDSAIL